MQLSLNDNCRNEIIYIVIFIPAEILIPGINGCLYRLNVHSVMKCRHRKLRIDILSIKRSQNKNK